MSNELATQQDNNNSFSFFNIEQFNTMQRVAGMFANSELVPEMYRITAKNPKEKAIANCIIAIEMAHRIGTSPLMIMQNLTPIHGKPAWASKFLIATVNTCGRFNPMNYRFRELGKVGKIDIVEYIWSNEQGKKVAVKNTFDGSAIENIECIAYTTARGSEDLLESSPITVELAIREGWYNKAGSKWPTMTKQMLIYRAASFWTNAYAPDLSMGMKTEHEMLDIVEDIPYVDVPTKVEAEIKENANKTVITLEEQEDENCPI